MKHWRRCELLYSCSVWDCKRLNHIHSCVRQLSLIYMRQAPIVRSALHIIWGASHMKLEQKQGGGLVTYRGDSLLLLLLSVLLLMVYSLFITIIIDSPESGLSTPAFSSSFPRIVAYWCSWLGVKEILSHFYWFEHQELLLIFYLLSWLVIHYVFVNAIVNDLLSQKIPDELNDGCCQCHPHLVGSNISYDTVSYELKIKSFWPTRI